MGSLGPGMYLLQLSDAYIDIQANAQYSGSNMDRGFFDTVVSLLFEYKDHDELTYS